MRFIYLSIGVLVAFMVTGSVLAVPGAVAQMSPPAAATSQMAGSYRVVLGFLPAEPFYTAEQVQQEHVTDGMMIVGGATPVPPNAASRPNHHLVFHIFDAAGNAVRGAHVTIAYAPTAGDATGTNVTQVPVVEMQAVGKGPESTHYGNNVTLAPGTYNVMVTVNDSSSTTFVVKATP